MKKILILPLLAVFLFGCQANMPRHKVHHSMVQNETFMQEGNYLLLPMDISVQELSAGGLTEEVPGLTKQAEENFETVMSTRQVGQLSSEQLVDIPELTVEEKAQFDQSVVLLKTLLSDVFQYTSIYGGPAWKHKSLHFDYTMGPGFSFLADKTGADKALLLIGEDMHSTAGRKATMVVVAALTGAVIPTGHTVVAGGMIDLKTGDVLWANTFVSIGSENFLTTSSTSKILDTFFKPYPGAADYRKLKK